MSVSLYGEQAKWVNDLVRQTNAQLRANVLTRSMVLQAAIERLRRESILDETEEKVAMWFMLNRRDHRGNKE